jgi:small subunit ribosomal protein S20
MPLTKSAIKALKVSERRKVENDLTRAKIKSAVKGAKISIAKQGSDVAEKIQTLYRELDLAAKKNVIHKNKASRLKSRITKTANQTNEIVAVVKPTAKKEKK